MLRHKWWLYCFFSIIVYFLLSRLFFFLERGLRWHFHGHPCSHQGLSGLSLPSSSHMKGTVFQFWVTGHMMDIALQKSVFVDCVKAKIRETIEEYLCALHSLDTFFAEQILSALRKDIISGIMTKGSNLKTVESEKYLSKECVCVWGGGWVGVGVRAWKGSLSYSPGFSYGHRSTQVGSLFWGNKLCWDTATSIYLHIVCS